MAKIDKLLEQMAKTQASDLHIAVGQPPKFRIHGDLGPITDKPLTKDVLESYLFEILNEQQLGRFQRDHDLDFAYGLEGVARFRVNYYMQQHGIGGAFRLIPSVLLCEPLSSSCPITGIFEKYLGYPADNMFEGQIFH